MRQAQIQGVLTEKPRSRIKDLVAQGLDMLRSMEFEYNKTLMFASAVVSRPGSDAKTVLRQYFPGEEVTEDSDVDGTVEGTEQGLDLQEQAFVAESNANESPMEVERSLQALFNTTMGNPGSVVIEGQGEVQGPTINNWEIDPEWT